MKQALGWILAGVFVVALSGCGSDAEDAVVDAAEVAADADSNADTEAGDAADADGAADDADGAGDSDGGADAGADEGTTPSDDMIDSIMSAIGLSGDVLDGAERQCINDELQLTYGESGLPADLSFTNIELWEVVNGVAEACGADIGL